MREARGAEELSGEERSEEERRGRGAEPRGQMRSEEKRNGEERRGERRGGEERGIPSPKRSSRKKLSSIGSRSVDCTPVAALVALVVAVSVVAVAVAGGAVAGGSIAPAAAWERENGPEVKRGRAEGHRTSTAGMHAERLGLSALGFERARRAYLRWSNRPGGSGREDAVAGSSSSSLAVQKRKVRSDAERRGTAACGRACRALGSSVHG